MQRSSFLNWLPFFSNVQQYLIVLHVRARGASSAKYMPHFGIRTIVLIKWVLFRCQQLSAAASGCQDAAKNGLNWNSLACETTDLVDGDIHNYMCPTCRACIIICIIKRDDRFLGDNAPGAMIPLYLFSIPEAALANAHTHMMMRWWFVYVKILYAICDRAHTRVWWCKDCNL